MILIGCNPPKEIDLTARDKSICMFSLVTPTLVVCQYAYFIANQFINFHGLCVFVLCFFQESDSAGTVDLRHFAFYAFAGRSGELRWTRKKEVIIYFYPYTFFLWINSSSKLPNTKIYVIHLD